MKSFRNIFLVVLMAVAFVGGPTGCATKLEPGGSYHQTGQAPDKAFYATEASFDLAYAVVDAAFKFERDNRQMLWELSPSIKHGLDAIRPNASQIVVTYAKARAAYLKNPTPNGLSTLQTVLSQMQQLAQAAQAAVPK